MPGLVSRSETATLVPGFVSRSETATLVSGLVSRSETATLVPGLVWRSETATLATRLKAGETLRAPEGRVVGRPAPSRRTGRWHKMALYGNVSARSALVVLTTISCNQSISVE